MRSRRYVPFLFPALCLPITIPACDGEPFSAGVSALTIEVTTNRDSLILRDTLRITVTAMNSTPYLVSEEVIGEGVSFAVLNDKGEKVGGPPPNVFPSVESPPRLLTLAPGASIEREFTWAPYLPPAYTSLPPGEYSVEGRVEVVGDGVAGAPRRLELLPIVRLEAAAQPAQVELGESVEVMVTLTNLDARPARLPAFTSCFFQALVMRGDAPVTFLSQCPPGHPEQVLAAGEAAVTVFQWQATEPGEYRAWIRVDWEEQPGLEAIVPFQVN